MTSSKINRDINLSGTTSRTALFFSTALLTVLLIVVLFSADASAACINLTSGLKINESSTLCPGSHIVNATVNITANDVSLDCANAVITTTDVPESAISIVGKNNVTISNCIIRNHKAGINSLNSNLTLQNSQLSQDNIGIISNNSRSRIISGTFTSNNISVLLDQNLNSYLYLNTINSNINNSTAIFVVRGNNNSIINNMILSNYIGIRLYYSENNSLSSNTINSNALGLLIENGSKNSVTNNVFNANSLYGIFVNSSINNTIVSNHLYINNITDTNPNLTINSYFKNSH